MNELNQLEEANNDLVNHLNNFADEMKKEKEVSKELGAFAS